MTRSSRVAIASPSRAHGSVLANKVLATSDKELRRVLRIYQEFAAAADRLRVLDQRSVEQLVELVNGYRRDVLYTLEDRDNSGQENLRSTILEEFFFYLFRGVVERELGGIPPGLVLRKESQCYVDLTFAPKSFKEVFATPNPYIHTKDQDFVIGAGMVFQVKPVRSSLEPAWTSAKRQYLRLLAESEANPTTPVRHRCAKQLSVAVTELTTWEDEIGFQTELEALRAEIRGQKQAVVPVIAIECKTYIERTMLDACAGTARRLKAAMPYCLYIVAAEYVKLEDANPELTAIDEVFILCKASIADRNQRKRDGAAPHDLDPGVIIELFTLVISHLRKIWWSPADALQRGRIIGRP